MARVLLLADSEPLFREEGRGAVVASLPGRAVPATARVAYVGASNGDEPAFAELARAAMTSMGMPHVRVVPSAPSDDDRAYLAGADLVVLSGGDPGLGWERFVARGLVSPILRSAQGGGTILGVSAGAIQLGPTLLDHAATPALGLLPMLVGVHDEPTWTTLVSAVRARAGAVEGLGVPWRGVAIADGALVARLGAIVIARLDGERVRLCEPSFSS